MLWVRGGAPRPAGGGAAFASVSVTKPGNLLRPMPSAPAAPLAWRKRLRDSLMSSAMLIARDLRSLDSVARSSEENVFTLLRRAHASFDIYQGFSRTRRRAEQAMRAPA